MFFGMVNIITYHLITDFKSLNKGFDSEVKFPQNQVFVLDMIIYH